MCDRNSKNLPSALFQKKKLTIITLTFYFSWWQAATDPILSVKCWSSGAWKKMPPCAARHDRRWTCCSFSLTKKSEVHPLPPAATSSAHHRYSPWCLRDIAAIQATIPQDLALLHLARVNWEGTRGPDPWLQSPALSGRLQNLSANHSHD